MRAFVTAVVLSLAGVVGSAAILEKDMTRPTEAPTQLVTVRADSQPSSFSAEDSIASTQRLGFCCMEPECIHCSHGAVDYCHDHPLRTCNPNSKFPYCCPSKREVPLEGSLQAREVANDVPSTLSTVTTLQTPTQVSVIEQATDAVDWGNTLAADPPAGQSAAGLALTAASA